MASLDHCKLNAPVMLTKILHHLKPIIFSLITIWLCFGALDALWLGVVAQDWYMQEMAGLLRDEFIRWPWVAFYLLYSFVLLVLVVIANRDKPIWYAAIDGAFLGAASYGAYNLTNYSLIDGFSLFIAIVDWTWGVTITCLSAMAGWAGFRIASR